MLKTSLFTVVIVAAVIFIGCVDKQNSIILLSAVHDPAAAKVPAIRVGTYDSRAIAVAFAHSQWQKEIMQPKLKEMEKAKAANDKAKIDELDEWGSSYQHKMHLQGFGTAPVHEYIEYVKKELPAIAKASGVDVIVSKWEFDYTAKGAKTVDVTDAIVKLYNPSEKTLKIIDSLVSKKPLAEDVVLKHKH